MKHGRLMSPDSMAQPNQGESFAGISAGGARDQRSVIWLFAVTSGLLCAGSASLDVFGIFDGHGGKQAAAFASKHLAPVLLGELQQGSKPSESPGSHPCAAAAGGSSGRGGAGGEALGSPGELDEAAEVLACEEVRACSLTYIIVLYVPGTGWCSVCRRCGDAPEEACSGQLLGKGRDCGDCA